MTSSRAALCLALVVVVGATAGCGGTSFQSAISHIGSAVRAYNESNPADLHATGEACRSAADDLASQRAAIDGSTSAAAAAGAVRRAYHSALAGLKDCAAAAPTLNYARMARSNSEIADANRWLQKARALDH